jgi:hypothetical protein
MTRTSLTVLRGSIVTPDVAERVRLLELRLQDAWKGKARLQYSGVPAAVATWEGVRREPGPTGITTPALSMRPTGRELYLRVIIGSPDDATMRAAGVEALWAVAVPLGFVPWNRHPVPGPCDEVFHVPGPWAALMESHWAFGEGERAWASMCCAAQVEVGRWEGDRPDERALQVHLHRLGYPCGPVDGVVGERVLAAVRRTPLAGLPVAQAASAAAALPDPAPRRPEAPGRRVGVLDVPGEDVSATGHGGAKVSRTPRGYSIEVDGPGRVVIDFGGYAVSRR